MRLLSIHASVNRFEFSLKKPKYDIVVLAFFFPHLGGFFIFLVPKKIFWPCHIARGIFVVQPGIEPTPPALSLNCWTTREVPQWILCAPLGVVLQDGTHNVT